MGRAIEGTAPPPDAQALLAHELRTPLASLKAAAEILRDHPDLPVAERREYVDIIVAECERLTRRVDRVLDGTRRQAIVRDASRALVDLRAAAQYAIDATAPLFRAKHVAVDLRAPAAVPPVRAERDALVQVLENLLSNAVKFAPDEGGRVVVDVVATEGSLEVRVTDNGAGVAAADRQRIFQPYRRAGDAAAAARPGTGLGLAMSREIIAGFGGRLWLASAPGEGAAFAFALPVPRATVAEE